LRIWNPPGDSDQPTTRPRLGNRQRAGADASQRNRDFERPRLLVQSHRRQRRQAVRHEHPAKVNHLARRPGQREFDHARRVATKFRASRYPSKPRPEITPFAAAAVTIRCRSGSRAKTFEMWTSTTGLPEPRSASASARLECENAPGLMMIASLLAPSFSIQSMS